MERRTLVWLLVALGLGIPILIELWTFFGLIQAQVDGDEGGGTRPSPDGRRRVGVGDELLPGTDPDETVTEAVVRADEEPWTFVLSVQVRNDEAGAYELRLGSATLGNGDVVEGGASTGQVEPGETTTVTGSWELPPGTTPRAVAVVAILYSDDATPEIYRETVRLAKVPVSGR